MDAVLASAERARRDRLIFDRDRRDFTAAHALLRTSLSRYGMCRPSEWQFETDYYGKPSLVPAQARATSLAFNLSHTQGLVACALARETKVGIDVETCDRLGNALQVAHQYFTSSECNLLSGRAKKDAQARFIELWTLKESYIKAVGVGLSVPLNSFSFMFEGNAGLTFTCQYDRRHWQFWLAALSLRSRIAIAVSLDRAGAPRQISFHDEDGESAVVIVCRTTHHWNRSRHCTQIV
jgi:4'-phosphopantetheinyl transferase